MEKKDTLNEIALIEDSTLEEDDDHHHIAHIHLHQRVQILQEETIREDDDTTKAEVDHIHDIVIVTVKVAEIAEAQVLVPEANIQVLNLLQDRADILIAQRAIQKAEVTHLHQSIVIIKRIRK